jgi:phenylacetate-CoA ligase
VAEFRIVVTRQRAMTHVRLELEPHPESDTHGLADSVAAAIKQQLQFQAEVHSVPTGTLPRFEMKAKRLVREDLQR